MSRMQDSISRLHHKASTNTHQFDVSNLAIHSPRTTRFATVTADLVK
jgi:hypothetical protein